MLNAHPFINDLNILLKVKIKIYEMSFGLLNWNIETF